jgi:membrane-bound lytic murein transglycosylase B
MLFFPKSVSVGTPPSKTSVHEQFLTPAAIRKASGFFKANRTALENAEKQYGVDPHVITAIMLVETGFGENTGKWPVVNSLSTLAALGNPDNRRKFWDMMPSERKHSWEQYESRACKKAEWAYGELRAFLDLAIMAGIQPETVQGSYAGAIGIPQFMPSNILPLAKDGDNDGFIDVFNHSDAIASIANYMKESGWKRGAGYDSAFSVVLRYNKSGTYARTVLEIADRLKGV